MQDAVPLNFATTPQVPSTMLHCRQIGLAPSICHFYAKPPSEYKKRRNAGRYIFKRNRKRYSYEYRHALHTIEYKTVGIVSFISSWIQPTKSSTVERQIQIQIGLHNYLLFSAIKEGAVLSMKPKEISYEHFIK